MRSLDLSGELGRICGLLSQFCGLDLIVNGYTLPR